MKDTLFCIISCLFECLSPQHQTWTKVGALNSNSSAIIVINLNALQFTSSYETNLLFYDSTRACITVRLMVEVKAMAITSEKIIQIAPLIAQSASCPYRRIKSDMVKY